MNVGLNHVPECLREILADEIGTYLTEEECEWTKRIIRSDASDEVDPETGETDSEGLTRTRRLHVAIRDLLW